MMGKWFPGILILCLGIQGISPFPSAIGQEDPPSGPAPKITSSEDGEKAMAFLDAIYKQYHIPLHDGLNAIEAVFRIQSTQDPALKRMADGFSINYQWEANGRETLQVRGGSGVYQKTIKESLQGIWRDLVGGGVFPVFEGKDLILEVDGMNATLFLSSQGKALGKVIFDSETKIVTRAEVKGLGKGVAVVPTYGLSNGRLRLEERRMVATGKEGVDRPRNALGYGNFREINHFSLPTRITAGLNRNQMILQVEYTRINQEAALMMEADQAEVKALIKEYDKNYAKWSAVEKLEAHEKLVETGHEKAAEAIAKRGLKDKDLKVRQKAVKSLGIMKCRKVVTTLIRALKSNKKNPEVFLEIIRCLGDLGDPKAIPALSSNMWSNNDDLRGNETAKEKIKSLGRIRSKKSVEALIDLMYMAKPHTMGTIRATLRESLESLTDQKFRQGEKRYNDERDAWKSWWNDNKNRFKLEEDR